MTANPATGEPYYGTIADTGRYTLPSLKRDTGSEQVVVDPHVLWNLTSTANPDICWERRDEGTATGGQPRAVTPGESQVRRRPDLRVIERAKELLDGLEDTPFDPTDAVLTLESIRTIVFELWPSVLRCSDNHHDLLALIKSATREWPELNVERIGALREAFLYLGSSRVVDASLEVITSRFIALGWQPLAPFTELSDDEDDGREASDSCPDAPK